MAKRNSKRNKHGSVDGGLGGTDLRTPSTRFPESIEFAFAERLPRFEGLFFHEMFPISGVGLACGRVLELVEPGRWLIQVIPDLDEDPYLMLVSSAYLESCRFFLEEGDMDSSHCARMVALESRTTSAESPAV